MVSIKLEVPFEFPYTDRMKNKEYLTESEMNEELAENTGEFIDWLSDTIIDRIYKCSKIKDFKGMGVLNELLDDIREKLEQE